MIIDGRPINADVSPYVIAEISGNHGGVIKNALRLIREAKAAGATAVKLQAYTPDTITLDCDRPDFVLTDGPWAGRRLYDLYRAAHTPFDWFPALFAEARRVGITCFASVFDKSSVDMLQSLDCPAYKIASFEIVDTPLIRYAAKTGKPLIVSTGMASELDVIWAYRAYQGDNRPRDNIAFLHCVSGYPTPVAEANLQRLRRMVEFEYCAGLSDHTRGIEIPIAATVLGTRIIEKHLRLADVETEDAAFSLRPGEFKAMVHAVRSVWAALQPSQATSEASSRPLRRSLYAVADIKPGEPLTEANVRSIRPGYGLPPRMLPEVLGRTAACEIARGMPMTMDFIAPPTQS